MLRLEQCFWKALIHGRFGNQKKKYDTQEVMKRGAEKDRLDGERKK